VPGAVGRARWRAGGVARFIILKSAAVSRVAVSRRALHRFTCPHRVG